MDQQKPKINSVNKKRVNKPGAGRPPLPPGVKGTRHNSIKINDKIVKRIENMNKKMLDMKISDYKACRELEKQLNDEMSLIQNRLLRHTSDSTMANYLENN